jgi:uncharacterized protein (TIGR02453 family)
LPSDPPFRGWSDEALAFYRGLEADNSKSYWTAHKPVFDAQVYAPMEALVSELEPVLGVGRIMRPYRDIRFTKDKSPYRTALGARIGDGYVQISAGGLRAGCGSYHLAPDQLGRYREAVDRESTGVQLVGVIDTIRSHDIEVSGADPLRTAPRGYSPDHARIELLRYKGVIAWKRWPVEPWLASAAAKDRVLELLATTAPLMQWLNTHVGASTEPPRRRFG